MRTEITEEQRHEIKEAFELFDSDKDGVIDYHGLKVGVFLEGISNGNRLQCVLLDLRRRREKYWIF